jgi:hypothetical protein
VTQSSRCLVIDADIASAATDRDTKDARSKDCREFLLGVKDTRHKVVSTEAIRAEWNKHQSRFTKAWLVSMYARRKVCWIDAPADDELHTKVEQCATSENKREAMLKDIHLIEAAFQADRIVVSMDEAVRHCFHEVTHEIRKLKLIAWVNPCKSEETPLNWLHSGAEPERERLLGYRKENANA